MIRGESAPLGGAKCSDVCTYLKKDRYTPDDTASPNRKPQLDPTKNVSCNLCDMDLSLHSNDNELVVIFKKSHYMFECSSVPGPPIFQGATRQDQLDRIAALGIRLRLTEEGFSTDNIENGVFRFTGYNVSAGSRRDGPQRSDKEPPDIG